MSDQLVSCMQSTEYPTDEDANNKELWALTASRVMYVLCLHGRGGEAASRCQPTVFDVINDDGQTHLSFHWLTLACLFPSFHRLNLDTYEMVSHLFRVKQVVVREKTNNHQITLSELTREQPFPSGNDILPQSIVATNNNSE